MLPRFRTQNFQADLRLYRRLLTYVLPYKWVFLLAIGGMLIMSAGNAAFIWALKPIVDEGFVNQNIGAVNQVLLVLVVAGGVRAGGSFLDAYCMGWVGIRVVRKLRLEMFHHLIRAPVPYYDRHSSARLTGRLINDARHVRQACTSVIRLIFADASKILFLMALMISINWQLSLLFLLVLPASYVIFTYSSRRVRVVSRIQQGNFREIMQSAKEVFHGQRLVKISDTYARERQNFKDINNQTRQNRMKEEVIAALTGSAVALLAACATIGIIRFAVLQGITAGDLAAYVVALTQITKPLQNLSQIMLQIQTALAGAESVFKMIDIGQEKDAGKVQLKKVKGEVVFEQVSFSYLAHDEFGNPKTTAKDAPLPKLALRDFSLRIKPGSSVALVGESGSGKSTVAALLLRFYPLTRGEIRIDGQPLDAISLASLRAHIAVVTQDITLFDDSIARNIAYDGKTNINHARLKQAATAANVMEFVDAMPDGLKTMVGEGGVLLSGGQRQRIAIARALYKNAPILIMDEATSSLDSKSEAHIRSATERLTQNRTTLIIAHRLSTIQNADNIVVLDHGEVVEQGDHPTLLKKGGAYAALYKAQFAKSARK